MRRIRYSVAASLDGFIAGPKGETDWIVMDPEIDFAELFREFDTLVAGRKSFETMMAMGGPMFPHMQVVVVSRTLQPHQAGVARVARDVQVLHELRQQPGKDIWLFGGGELFASAANAGLVDRVEVAIVPVLLGAGLPLAPRLNQPVGLRYQKQRLYSNSGILLVEYDVLPN
jgi:dihydrofolate reductase